MPYQIRHKATGEILQVNSGKSVWATASNAKASFMTSGVPSYKRDGYGYKPDGDKLGANGQRLGRKAWKFDEQEVFELVEVVDYSKRLTRAEELLAWAADYLDDVHAYDSEVAEAIRQYFKEQE